MGKKFKTSWQKIGKIVSFGAYSLIIVIAILVIFSTFSVSSYKLMTVQSGSMEPAIRAGSMIVVKPTAEYKTGNVVTYKNGDNPKKTTTHRIVEIKKEQGLITYKTKGDANDAPDFNPVFKESIVGRVLFYVPYLGYPVNFAKTLPGLVILIIIPAMIITYEEIRKIKKEVREFKKRRSPKNASLASKIKDLPAKSASAEQAKKDINGINSKVRKGARNE